MKTFVKFLNKNEKGQVLVILAVTITLLVALIGFAIDMGYMYLSYARLARAADAASLAGVGEFKRNYDVDSLQKAAEQVLYLNLDADQTTDTDKFPKVEVETCDTVADELGILREDMKDRIPDLIAADHSPYVCTDPLKKIVRTTVRENIQTFFLGITGISTLPIEVVSLAEAATVDLVMVIDTSESMSKGWWFAPKVGDDRDPSQCNLYDSCEPFLSIKNAASLFLDTLYFPYDRVGVVTFDKDAVMHLSLSDDYADVKDVVTNLTVFEGNQACPFTWEERAGQPNSYYPAIPGDDVNPCRLYSNASSFQYFDCPNFYGNTPDASACSSTNTSDGIAMAGAMLTGDYSSTGLPAGSWPAKRDQSLWVLLLLTDGAANSGHDSLGKRLCPSAENSYSWNYPICRDNDTLTRHCWVSTDTDCVNASYPDPLTTGAKSVVNQSLYDADDRARDMFDLVSKNGTLIFTIGMGDEKKKKSIDINNPQLAPGETLLQFGAFGTYTDMNGGKLKGLYYYGNDPAALNRIFLQIANNLATRINQ